MTIRAFFGFDDVPVPLGEQLVAAAVYTKLGALPFSFKSGSAASGGTTYVKENGFLKCKGSTSVTLAKPNYMQATTQLLGLVPSYAGIWTIGLRWMAPNDSAGAPNWIHPMVMIGTTTPTTANVLAASVFPYGSIPGYVPGQEYYLEAQWDAGANVVRRRVDGVPLADLTMVNGLGGAMGSGTTLFFSGILPSTVVNAAIELAWGFKDMYVLEKTGDGVSDTFLGPQRVYPVSVSSIDQATWAPTGAADVVTALNTGITDINSLATPLVTSDPANPVANIGLVTGVIQGQINAISLNATAKKISGTAGALSAQVVVSGQPSSTVTPTLTTTMAPVGNLYLGEKSPANNRWTTASIAAAKLKLSTS